MRGVAATALAALLTASRMLPALAQSPPSVITPGYDAQDNSVIVIPPAPAIVAAPPAPAIPAVPATPPPGLVQVNPPVVTDDGDGNADNGATSSAGGAGPPLDGDGLSQNQPQDQDAIPEPPNTWQPGKIAEIGVLDKIDGEVAQISVPVGGQSVVGDLQVNVLACVTRPPDQVPDAAVFLALQNTDTPSASPAYRGWLILSEPAAAVAGDASETFRIISCS